MASSSEEASNVMPSASDPQEPYSKEESSVVKDETLAPEEEGMADAVEEEDEDSGDSGEDSSLPMEEDAKNTLDCADELIHNGKKHVKAGDYGSAVDSLSRAVEIRVAHYGELAPECVKAYYEYGCALLYKAQEEADPLSGLPKKESASYKTERAVSNGENSESSAAPVVTDGKGDSISKSGEDGEGSSAPIAPEDKQESVSSRKLGEPEEAVASKRDEDDENEGSEDENLEELDEDESDLDLAWKLLDVARAIAEKEPRDTLDKVDILAALGEVSLEREDIETSLSDYQRALCMLEHLVEQDSRELAELNFRICLVLEVASRAEEALPYCRKAISICRDRMERLKEETNFQASSDAKTAAEPETKDSSPDEQPPDEQPPASTNLNKVEEIKTLAELLGDLEKKLEDLEQVIQNPKPILAEILKAVGSKTHSEKRISPVPQIATSSEVGRIMSGNEGFDSPTVSTGATSGGGSVVTDLGVVGRGVKRATPKPNGNGNESSLKKPALDQKKGEK